MQIEGREEERDKDWRMMERAEVKRTTNRVRVERKRKRRFWMKRKGGWGKECRIGRRYALR